MGTQELLEALWILVYDWCNFFVMVICCHRSCLGNVQRRYHVSNIGYDPNEPPQYGTGRVSVFGTIGEAGWGEILNQQKEKEERYYAEQSADIQAVRELVRNRVDKVFIRYYTLCVCLYAIYAIFVSLGFYNRYLQFGRHTIKYKRGFTGEKSWIASKRKRSKYGILT